MPRITADRTTVLSYPDTALDLIVRQNPGQRERQRKEGDPLLSNHKARTLGHVHSLEYAEQNFAFSGAFYELSPMKKLSNSADL